MLRELYIENFALIDKLLLNFESGVNVLSGETGAGKSILVGAVSLLLGARASHDHLRTGAEKAVVRGVFDLDERLMEVLSGFELINDEDDTVILSREISRTGKNLCRINGKSTNLSSLKDLGMSLIDIYGQNEHQRIASHQRQLDILDNYGGKDLFEAKETTSKLFKQYKELEAKISELTDKQKATEEQLDFMKYQLNEIDSANLKKGEEEEVEEQIKILSGAEHLANNSLKIYHELFGSDSEVLSAYDLISGSIESAEEMIEYDRSINEQIQQLKEALHIIEDTAEYFRNYYETVEFNPHRLQELEERMQLINRLTGKYKKSVEEILEMRDEISASLEEFEFGDDKIQDLVKEKERVKEEYYTYARLVTELRKSSADNMSSEVSQVLKGLDMKHASFEIAFYERDRMSENGLEEVEYLFTANPGEPLKPLHKTASGGELSRLMLALKSVFAKEDSVPTLIFDEIDSGVGGHTAHKIGEKMIYLSDIHQIICVTHSPQVASFGGVHFRIKKHTKDGRTAVNVEKLSENDRVNEIARMLGGEELKTAVQHAENMLSVARENKR